MTGSDLSAFSLTAPGTNDALHRVEQGLASSNETYVQSVEGIWDLVRADRRSSLDAFATQYAAVRAAEHRELAPAEVRQLPAIRADHPLADMWRQRSQSHQQFVDAIAGRAPGTAVDIGAGCAWLAADLARRGWNAAATDITVHGGDGLAAARHHHEPLVLIRAEMQAMPFATNSVDMAVFNASLHYAANVQQALGEARRIVRPGGLLIVFDSPVFGDEKSGHAMVAEFAAQVQKQQGLPAAPHEGPGFVMDEDLQAFGLTRTGHGVGVRARLHKWRGSRIAGREIASRPLAIATIGDSK